MNQPEDKYMTSLEPLFLGNGMLQPKEKLFRFDSPVSRYYYRFPAAGVEIPYMGATGVVDRETNIRDADQLIKWYAKHGELAYLLAKVAAAYGTQLHITIADFHRNGMKADFDMVEIESLKAAKEGGFAFEMDKWGYHLPRNLAAWIQFCEERQVEVLAVEYPVWDDSVSVATLCDIYCEMTFDKRRGRAIINIKKGYLDADKEDENKTFYPAQDLQLQIERRLWQKSLGAAQPVDWVFNWSPNNWRDQPTYTLKNWTDTKYPPAVLEHILQRVKMMPGYFSPPRKVNIMTGNWKAGGSLASNILPIRATTPKGK